LAIDISAHTGKELNVVIAKTRSEDVLQQMPLHVFWVKEPGVYGAPFLPGDLQRHIATVRSRSAIPCQHALVDEHIQNHGRCSAIYILQHEHVQAVVVVQQEWDMRERIRCDGDGMSGDRQNSDRVVGYGREIERREMDWCMSG
jgi:hypothetical protein